MCSCTCIQERHKYHPFLRTGVESFLTSSDNVNGISEITGEPITIRMIQAVLEIIHVGVPFHDAPEAIPIDLVVPRHIERPNASELTPLHGGTQQQALDAIHDIDDWQ